MIYTVGMIHLGALISAPKYEDNFDIILKNALHELCILEETGFNAAIVENFNDIPYSTEQSLETIIQYTRIFSILKENSKIKLGVNIQYTNTDVEMILATICGADFIRVENYVEKRIGSFGELVPLASSILRKKKLLNSNVKIYADINPKHSFNAFQQDTKYSVKEAIDANADYIIITGSETGKAPTLSDVELVKEINNNTKVIIGSGVSIDNVNSFKGMVDGLIVGSSVKIDGDVNNLLDRDKCAELIKRLRDE